MQVYFKRRALILASLAVSLLPATSVWAQSQPPKVLIVGDSLSAEYGLPRGAGWVALLEQRMRQDRIQGQVVNASISGETTSGGRTRLPNLLKQHQPQIVIIELGGNDALRGLPLKSTQDNIKVMMDAASAQGAKVLLLGMQMPPNYGKRYSSDFAKMYVTLAQQHQASLVPFFLAGVADRPDAREWFQADGIHPLPKAQPTMLNNVWPALKPLLLGR